MRRLLALTSVAVLTLTLAVPAGAAKPPKDPPGQNPLPGVTCGEAEFEDPGLYTIGSASDDFTVILTPSRPASCMDVTSNAGDWKISLTTVGAAYLEVQIKDSVPGDFCYREGFGKKKNPIPESPWSIEGLPAAAIDACTPGEVGLATDEDPALVFMVAYAPERNASTSGVTFFVDLP